MKLSDGEKLILMMLADMYKALKIKGDYDPDFIQETITSNYLWGFRWRYSGLFDEAPAVGEDVVTETCDVLDMWWSIEDAYAALGQPDRAVVEKDAAPFGKNLKFPGFDANNERHYGVARYLIEHLDRYDHFAGRNLNSHFPSIDGYRRMLSAYDRHKPSRRGKLTAEQLVEILKELVHPENR